MGDRAFNLGISQQLLRQFPFVYFDENPHSEPRIYAVLGEPYSVSGSQVSELFLGLRFFSDALFFTLCGRLNTFSSSINFGLIVSHGFVEVK